MKKSRPLSQVPKNSSTKNKKQKDYPIKFRNRHVSYYNTRQSRRNLSGHVEDLRSTRGRSASPQDVHISVQTENQNGSTPGRSASPQDVHISFQTQNQNGSTPGRSTSSQDIHISVQTENQNGSTPGRSTSPQVVHISVQTENQNDSTPGRSTSPQVVHISVQTENQNGNTPGRSTSSQDIHISVQTENQNGNGQEIFEDQESRMTEEISKVGEKIEDGNFCTICLNTGGDSKAKELYCKHSFHENCINEWLKRSYNCPVCRSLPDRISVCCISRFRQFSRNLSQWFLQSYA
ncbi:E3 ubiquitin-protein ligase RLIM-like [Uloborus diversus]|uniref:E3 ubiquitin-protein ligase RLIM-like n=1 Tax=Uloborus diversus TaxID=327109 RepID=UPI00240A665F|nr:E3 ubiquitin-protein ligase RLIM-like [Uloborus diversus]